ncbi:MAG: response regulator, partial [Xanthomonadales bacterium]|nr:response regulator [Xanthomonadales bacterium]
DSEAMMKARGTLSGQDREMYETVSAAVQDELSIVKDALDLELRTGAADADDRRQSLEALDRLIVTLSMLGLSGPAESMGNLVPAFKATAEASQQDREAALENLAAQLLIIESALTEQIETLGEPPQESDPTGLTGLSGHEYRRIRAVLLEECVVSMHAAEEAMRARFASEAGEDPQQPMTELAGALELAGERELLSGTQALMGALQELQDSVDAGMVLEQTDKEYIADALVALELSLAAKRDRQPDTSQLTGVLDERTATLLARARGMDADHSEPDSHAAPVASGDDEGYEVPAPPQFTQSPAPAPSEPELQPAPALPDLAATQAAEQPAEPEETAWEGAEVLAPAPEIETPEETPGAAPSFEEPAAPIAPAATNMPAAAADTEPEPTPDPVMDSEEIAALAAEDELPPEIDPELREIFLEEYETVLQTLQEAIPNWLAELENAEALTEIRRAFHTLKGSGRMVGADELGDFAWQIENMLNGLLEGHGKFFADASTMVRLSEAALPALRQRLLQQTAGLSSTAISAIGAVAATIAKDQPALWNDLRPHLPVYMAGLLPGGFDEAEPAAGAGQTDAAIDSAQIEQLAAELGPVRELVDAITKDRSTRTSPEQVTAVRAIGSMLTENPEGLDAEVAHALGDLLEAQANSGAEFSADAMFTLISAVGQLQNRLERMEGAGDLSSAQEQEDLLAQLERLHSHFDHAPAADLAAPETPASPSMTDFDPGRSVFANNADTPPSTTASAEDPATDLTDTDLSDFADAAPLPTQEESPAEEALEAEPATPEPGHESGFEAELEADAGTDPTRENPAAAAPLSNAPAPASEPELTPLQAAPVIAAPEPVRTIEEPVAEPVTASATDDADFAALDQEIIGIFLEEAAEVLERADSALNQSRDALDEPDWVQDLQREIHTFKGGARMAGLLSIGDYSHEMESLLERLAERQVPASLSAVALLEDACDRLQGWVEQVQKRRIPDASDALELLQQSIQNLNEMTPEAAAAPVATTPPAPPERTTVALQEQAPAEESEPDPDDPTSAGSIKVAAELLDRLVNASGEVSIFRSRLEQQVGKLKTNVQDFNETIDRLSDQFRKMDIEIEAQIRANYPDQVEAQGENFDPLELDQFSALQQATRSLQESVSDLQSLQEMAEENLRASEQLLTRQSRVSTELQEGLMKTRMVPFGSIAPRLRRIVRGSAREEGKLARLQLQMVGSSDELDRNVLEHITAPLEHMMRNAVAHGIETPEARAAAGKPEEGEITITVESETTEFVIRIADDGGGINLDAIRQRAMERGLLDAQEQPSREQLYAFMMDSGFSTSSSITRLAGRGVGMDVVNSDIKQIGGSLDIESEPGEGTQFTIRIPFTLAIMQAIGLQAGEARYLLPLSSVVGVSRIMPADYEKFMQSEQPVYKFAGQDYPLFDAEAMLGERPTPLGRANVSLLILRAGNQKAALRVPDLLPHREVVIKPVGPQISSVPGVLGGSISGDGEVMVILDPGPLLRRAVIHGIEPAPEAAWTQPARERRLVIVVDDSITMRKVTSRVLESNDYAVMTARDGVDALEKLQDQTPDLMLFDIEMPRMDGYELTERVRDDVRFRGTPIMMITSRAGQKHQDRAMQAGANAYLTKPYREDELIAEVERLLFEADSSHE